MRYEANFTDRMRQLVSDAWELFCNKVGHGHIAINKEASMQLQYAYILNSLLPHYLFSHQESAALELETGVKINDSSKEVDLLLVTKHDGKAYTIAIEMKCYKEYASSGGKRGATDIFMKDVYYDLYLLEQYCLNGIADLGIELVMTDLERLINPKNKDAKCWDYDISNGVKFGPVVLNTPIGGKEVHIELKKQYEISWTRNGPYWFAEIEGKK